MELVRYETSIITNVLELEDQKSTCGVRAGKKHAHWRTCLQIPDIFFSYRSVPLAPNYF
jgi:hypothetical protein